MARCQEREVREGRFIQEINGDHMFSETHPQTGTCFPVPGRRSKDDRNLLLRTMEWLSQAITMHKMEDGMDTQEGFLKLASLAASLHMGEKA